MMDSCKGVGILLKKSTQAGWHMVVSCKGVGI